MAKTYLACRLVAAVALALFTLPAWGADVPDNLISNGGFEAGMQIWRGDGKIVLLPDGNRVCEIEASKSRMKDLKQEFHMRQLQQVEVLFRARSINYTGPGIRISIHLIGGGSLIWNRDLPQDGSWREYRLVYTRTPSANDLRELNIATLFGTGQVQIDDVEVREPSKVAQNEPPEPSAPPVAPPAPPPKPFPPVASIKPPAPPIPLAPPANKPPAASLPAGTFGSLGQIIQSAPADALQKAQNDATKDDGAKELDEYFASKVKGQPARFHVAIDKTQPSVSNSKEFLVHISDVPATDWNGVPLSAWLWVRYTNEAEAQPDKLGVGPERIISGVITRCQVGRAGRLHLNVDIGYPKVESP